MDAAGQPRRPEIHAVEKIDNSKFYNFEFKYDLPGDERGIHFPFKNVEGRAGQPLRIYLRTDRIAVFGVLNFMSHPGDSLENYFKLIKKFSAQKPGEPEGAMLIYADDAEYIGTNAWYKLKYCNDPDQIFEKMPDAQVKLVALVNAVRELGGLTTFDEACSQIPPLEDKITFVDNMAWHGGQASNSIIRASGTSLLTECQIIISIQPQLHKLMKYSSMIIRPAMWLAAWLGLGLMLIPARAGDAGGRIQWWRDAKFGIFIHWGLYAIPGRGEWVQWNEQIPVEEYAKLANQFNPTNFTPDSWAKLAKSAGAKYVVLTSRHHDGFALFDDGTNAFTSVKTAARRDFVAEYVKAVRQEGLRVGLYYSPLDWRFPGFFLPDVQRASAEAMRDQYHRQVEALLSHYGKIDVLWFDGGEADWLDFGGDWSGAEWQKRPQGQHYHGGFDWQHNLVYARLRQLQPDILVNGRADMPEDFHSREGYGALGDFDQLHPWELCVPLAGAWGYQPNKPPKPLKDYIQLLAKVAGRDGNLLMNVGPNPNGQVDVPQADRLREIGAWLSKYGESIYATRGGPFLPGEWGAATCRGNSIYLHILKWPGEKLVLPALPAKVTGASALTGGKPSFAQTEKGLEISLPETARDEMDTIITLQLDSATDGIQPLK